MATAELILEREQESAQAWTLPAQIPELDGIRGLAILMVLVCHSAMWLPIGPARSVLIEGRIGVDLFFVLSGFLITGILLDTKGNRRALPKFYIRRGLRIWPLYFAFLVLAFGVMYKMVPPHLSPWAYILFVQNFFYVAGTGPMLDPTWSLAVEEQFYVVWPWIALRVKRETVLKICCAVMMMSPLIRIVMRLIGASDEFVYANTFCRLDGIAMGGAIASWVRAEDFEIARLRRFAQIGVFAGVTGTALCFRFASIPLATELRYSFVTFAFGGIVAWTVANQGSRIVLSNALRNFTLTGLGKISFALYLFNLPIYTLMHGRLADRVFLSIPAQMSGISRLVVGNVVLLVAAAASWMLYESRILRLKSKFAPR